MKHFKTLRISLIILLFIGAVAAQTTVKDTFKTQTNTEKSTKPPKGAETDKAKTDDADKAENKGKQNESQGSIASYKPEQKTVYFIVGGFFCLWDC